MSFQISRNDRILIVSPHPDDESIGCGGLMLVYGDQCEILLLTDGRKGYDSNFPIDEDELVELRKRELQSAVEIAGIDRSHIYMLGIPDGMLSEYMDKVREFDFTSYQYIFVPNHYERHKDHAPVSKLVQNICQHQKSGAHIYEYEVWSPLPSFSEVLDLGDVMELKVEMIQQYKTQIRFLDYVAMTKALNRYRGAGQKAKYAEVYAFVPKVSIIRKLYSVMPKPIQKVLQKRRGLLRCSK